MVGFLLDTSVIAELMKPRPSRKVIRPTLSARSRQLSAAPARRGPAR
jgi:predicted nucleic acid-binding protein